jgi:uncharacterized protein YoxC
MSQDFETNNPNPPQPAPSSKKSGPRLKVPVPPDLPHDDPEHGSRHRRLSTMVGINFLLLLVLIVTLGLIIFRKVDLPMTAEAKPDDSKGLTTDIDQLKSEIAGLNKKLGEMATPPDLTPQIKSLDDKVADLYKSMAETPARIESLNQKVESLVKSEAFAPAPRVDEIEKKVTELTQTVDSLKTSLSNRATPAAAEAASESPAMGQAVDLFKKGKFLEAKEAFARLQSAMPDDARVWYFSALANGLATRDWRGESERLVTTGVEKEKAGSPDHAKIDAAFADLTTNTGKEWLSFYRKKAAQ